MSETPRKRQHSISCEFPEGCSCGASEWNELLDKLAAANERAARLEGDAEILNWLESEAYNIHVSDTKHYVTRAIDGKEFCGDTLREAVRAALRADSAQKENKS